VAARLAEATDADRAAIVTCADRLLARATDKAAASSS
jgi:hypothetical protein